MSSGPNTAKATGPDAMLEKKTVFLLGAGSSADYDYPIGVALSKLMAKELAGDTSLVTALRQSGYGQNDVMNFREAFFKSGKNSIDAFLEHRLDFLD